jgi:hypothetical protein
MKLTTRGIFFEGFCNSPAVRPKLSVPPSRKGSINEQFYFVGKRKKFLILTSIASRHENFSKSTETSHKGGARDTPILGPDKRMRLVESKVHEQPDDDEDDDSHNFKQGKPIFC